MLFRKFPAQFGKYLLLDRIAAGGMAEVYRAKLPGVENFHKLLAIKCMLPRLTASKGFADMFIDEANLSSILFHPNIAQIHELGRLDDLLYIAMELVNGRDMGHIIRVTRVAHIQTPIPFACYVAVKAAEALDYAHHRAAADGTPLNLVHRDVSPQNILVSYDGEVKVVDFGIAKADVRLAETAGGVLKGKVPYMAPEHARGRPVDKRTDVFALGIVLFETLTGRRLYTARTHLEVMEQARDAVIPPIQKRYPHVPAELETVIRKALSADPDDRYATADELAQALSAFLIDGNVLYGSRQAARFMAELFSDEIEEMRARELSYASLTLEDCVEVKEVTDTVELYSSSFEEPTAVVKLHRPTASTDEISSTTIDITVADGKIPAAMESPRRDAERTEVVAIGQSVTDRRMLYYAAGGLGAIIVVVTLTALFDSETPRRVGTTVAEPAASTATPTPSPVQPTVADNIDVGVVRPAPPASKARPPAKKPSPPEPRVRTPAPKSPAASPRPVVASPKVVSDVGKARPAATPKRKKRDSPVRHGYLSLRAKGVTAAKIFLDGAEIGYSPILLRRVRVGKHQVRIVEQIESGRGKKKTLDIAITAKNTERDPLRLVVDL